MDKQVKEQMDIQQDAHTVGPTEKWLKNDQNDQKFNFQANYGKMEW